MAVARRRRVSPRKSRANICSFQGVSFGLVDLTSNVCSTRTSVPMIACVLVPGFELRAALRKRPGLALRPAALAPQPGTEPLVGPVTAAAEAAGVRPGMRLGEALATLPVARPRRAGSRRRSSRSGRSSCVGSRTRASPVEPAEPGCVYFETRAVERLYGGLEPALKRALAAVGRGLGPADRRRRAPLRRARSGERRAGGAGVIVSDEQTRARSSRRCRSTLLPLERGAATRSCEELGVRTLGQLAGLPGGAVAERLGPDGRRAWSLARGEAGRAVSVPAGRPRARSSRRSTFPDAVGERADAPARRSPCSSSGCSPDRSGRGGSPRKLALGASSSAAARGAGRSTLREPTAEPARLRPRARPEARRAAGTGARAAARAGGARRARPASSSSSLTAEGDEPAGPPRRGAAPGAGEHGRGRARVVEVAPWSRIPEARALLVPRDE